MSSSRPGRPARPTQTPPGWHAAADWPLSPRAAIVVWLVASALFWIAVGAAVELTGVWRRPAEAPKAGPSAPAGQGGVDGAPR